MSWPTRTWTRDGWVHFRPPGGGPPSGLPDNWKNWKNTIDKSDYWDILENPLYEAAANASGIDWEQWKADSFEDIGLKDDYEFDEPETSRRPIPGAKPPQVFEKWSGMEGGGKWVDFERNNVGHLNIVEKNEPGTVRGLKRSSTGKLEYFDWDNENVGDGDVKNWGIDRSLHGSVAEDLDEMHSWLGSTIKTHSLQDMPIVERGPEGSDYGIDGDIWEYYGLDEPPEAPKEMDINYSFNLAELKPSNKTYITPVGYPKLDTSTESMPFEESDYAMYMGYDDPRNLPRGWPGRKMAIANLTPEQIADFDDDDDSSADGATDTSASTAAYREYKNKQSESNNSKSKKQTYREKRKEAKKVKDDVKKIAGSMFV